MGWVALGQLICPCGCDISILIYWLNTQFKVYCVQCSKIVAEDEQVFCFPDVDS